MTVSIYKTMDTMLPSTLDARRKHAWGRYGGYKNQPLARAAAAPPLSAFAALASRAATRGGWAHLIPPGRSARAPARDALLHAGSARGRAGPARVPVACSSREIAHEFAMPACCSTRGGEQHGG